MAENREETRLDPQAMSPAELARALSRGGEAVTEQMVLEDLAAGAPANRDGTINLMHFTAWLAREVRDGA